MKHKVTYKTPDGVLQEQMFDDFDEFCDNIEGVAHKYYEELRTPDKLGVETVLDNGEVRNERLSIEDGPELLSE
tara:strand:- start:152 stop:373 length:222 start_codon:yes stop_codon:yes gene_type:complete